jgi:hypothetical protein
VRDVNVPVNAPALDQHREALLAEMMSAKGEYAAAPAGRTVLNEEAELTALEAVRRLAA